MILRTNASGLSQVAGPQLEPAPLREADFHSVSDVRPPVPPKAQVQGGDDEQVEQRRGDQAAQNDHRHRGSGILGNCGTVAWGTIAWCERDSPGMPEEADDDRAQDWLAEGGCRGGAGV